MGCACLFDMVCIQGPYPMSEANTCPVSCILQVRQNTGYAIFWHTVGNNRNLKTMINLRLAIFAPKVSKVEVLPPE